MLENAKLDWARSWLHTPKSSFAGGKWLASSGKTIDSTNPANGERLGSFHESTSADIEAAVAAARAAFDGPWSKVGRKERGKLLNAIATKIREHGPELATLESLDNGKLFSESLIDDIPESADIFDYYAGWTDKFHGETLPVEGDFLNYTVRAPVGVCALVVPWNFPLLLACWKIAPALAMGNTVIVKPSPATSFSMIRLFEIIEGILPDGVLNLALGGAEAGDLIGRHSGIDKISFTGSTAVGKRIVHNSADSNLKRITLELGGKSPSIIFDDAPDLDSALERAFTAMFSHKGEKCSEPTRLIVHRKHYDRFLKYLAERAEAVVCGDAFDEKSMQGPQCTREQMEKCLNYIEIGKKEGARLIAGGTRDTKGENAKGYFVRPTIFADVTSKMKIAQDEIFGPVLVVIPFETEDEAVRIANDSVYGLAAGLYTKDLSRAHRVAARLDAGMVFVNKYGCYDFASPFGGFKQSGWGKEMAIHSLEAYTKTKSIWVKV